MWFDKFKKTILIVLSRLEGRAGLGILYPLFDLLRYVDFSLN